MAQAARDIAAGIAADVVAGRLAPGARAPSVRALAREWHCAPGTAAKAHLLLRDAGVIGGPPRTKAVVTAQGVAAALALTSGATPVRLAGSDDPALDLLLSLAGSLVETTTEGQGSVNGLGLLARGQVDAAAIHLHDPSGTGNDAFARRVLGGQPAHLVHLWRREQGLIVASGNPKGIHSVADLRGLRLAWRPTGTGSRLLLSRLLHEADVKPEPDGDLCHSHLAVAVAVATGAADAGLAVRSAAESVGAEFVPVAWEDFELAVAPGAMASLQPVLDLLASGDVHRQVEELGGYDLSRAGNTRLAS